MKELADIYNEKEDRRSLIEGLQMRLLGLIPCDFLEQCPSANATVWLEIFTKLNRTLLSVSIETVKSMADEALQKYSTADSDITTTLRAINAAEEYNDRICHLMSMYLDLEGVEVPEGDDTCVRQTS